MTNHPPNAANPSNKTTKMTFTNKRRSSDRVGLVEETQLSGGFLSYAPVFGLTPEAGRIFYEAT